MRIIDCEEIHSSSRVGRTIPTQEECCSVNTNANRLHTAIPEKLRTAVGVNWAHFFRGLKHNARPPHRRGFTPSLACYYPIRQCPM